MTSVVAAGVSPGSARHFRSVKFDFASFFFTGLTGFGVLLILAMLFVLLGVVTYQGWSSLTWGR